MQTLGPVNERNKQILKYLFKNDKQTIRIRKIAQQLKFNVASVSIFVRKMINADMVKNGQIDNQNPYTRAWRIFLNIEMIAPYLDRIMRGFGADGLGLYGSWIKGTNNEKSDIDFWVKVTEQPNEIDTARMRAKIRKWIGAEPSFIFITKKRLEELEKNNQSLYFALVNSYHLGGEWLD